MGEGRGEHGILAGQEFLGDLRTGDHTVEPVEGALDDVELAVHAGIAQSPCVGHVLVVEEIERPTPIHAGGRPVRSSYRAGAASAGTAGDPGGSPVYDDQPKAFDRLSHRRRDRWSMSFRSTVRSSSIG